jgi:AcrR family transcriptional regulator
LQAGASPSNTQRTKGEFEMSEAQPLSQNDQLEQCVENSAAKTAVPADRRGRPANPNARTEILKAAAAAFMERGFSGTSVDDIAKDIGVTKGFIYHQFENKSDLYFSVQEIATRRFHDAVHREYIADTAPAEKLMRMALAHMTTMLADFPAAKVGVQGLERSLMRAAGDAEDQRLQRYIQMRDEYEAMFMAVIREGIAQHQFGGGKAGILTKGFLGTLNWATIWFDPKRPTSQQKLADIAQTLAAIAVRGLRI